jgi:hypothetical protein
VFSPASGLKSGQFDRNRNFGNEVSYKGLTKKTNVEPRLGVVNLKNTEQSESTLGNLYAFGGFCGL